MPTIAIGFVLILAVIALAIQHAHHTERVDNLRKTAKRHALETVDAEVKVNALQAELAHSQDVHEAVINALTADLARERRGKTLLYAAVLEAQREVDQMAEVIEFPGRGA